MSRIAVPARDTAAGSVAAIYARMKTASGSILILGANLISRTAKLIDRRAAFSRLLEAVAISGSLVIPASPILGHEFQKDSIIDGHRIQPRQSELRADGISDVTAAEAAEIDQLYQQLMGSRPSAYATANIDQSRNSPQGQYRISRHADALPSSSGSSGCLDHCPPEWT